jgi:hypothetical protein
MTAPSARYRGPPMTLAKLGYRAVRSAVGRLRSLALRGGYERCDPVPAFGAVKRPCLKRKN